MKVSMRAEERIAHGRMQELGMGERPRGLVARALCEGGE